MRLLDSERHGIELGDEVGRGGEGAVYAVQGQFEVVAKIYTQPPNPERVDKLSAMVELFHLTPSLADWCAWPQSLLRDETDVVRGFLMPRVQDHRPVHDAYNPEQRKAAFPAAGWDFLVRTASNCARMFATLHEAEVVVGDVNERNLLIGRDATVSLVDCDSFQLERGPRLFRTAVGVVDYTPPELQGADFSAIIRTPNHDRFGLAVILFKLLFLGRHPFSGGATGELSVAIRERRFDYADLSARMRHLVPLQAVSAQLQAMFQGAFLSDADAERPTPEQWLHALVAFEADLVACPREPLHRIALDAPGCLWCDIEQTLGYAYFAPPQTTPYQSDWTPQPERLVALREVLAGLDTPMDPSWYDAPPAVLQAIEAAHRSLHADPPPEATSWYVRVLGGLATLAGTALLAIQGPEVGAAMMAGGAATWAMGALLHRRKQQPWRVRTTRLQRLGDDLKRAEGEWKGEAYRFRAQDLRLRATFEQLAKQYEDLDGWRNQELARLERDVVGAHVRDALGQVRLEDMAIPGVSADRKRALLIRGLVTAADLERARLTGLPGLTQQHVDAAVTWRQALERQLGGQRRAPPTQAQRAGVDQNCRHIRDNLELELRGVLADIRDHATAADDALVGLYGRSEAVAAQALVLADALWLESRG